MYLFSRHDARWAVMGEPRKLSPPFLFIQGQSWDSHQPHIPFL